MSTKEQAFSEQWLPAARKAYADLERHWETGTSEQRAALETLSDILVRLESVIKVTDARYVSSEVLSNVLNTTQKLAEQGSLYPSDPQGVWTRVHTLKDRLLELAPLLRPIQESPSSDFIVESILKQEETKFSSLRQMILEFRDEVQTARDQILDQERVALETVERISSLSTDAEKLAHYHSGRALEGFFAERAEKHETTAREWTRYTWAFAFGTILSLLIFILFATYGSRTGSNWPLLASKAVITATLGLVAKWCSKRANRHLNEESRYRRLAINMATLDSFIASLDKEMRDRIYVEVALKTFTDSSGNESPVEFETTSLADVAKPTLEKLLK